MGARLLRVNILSPITGNFERVCIQILETLTSRISVQAAIEARLDVVEGQHSSTQSLKIIQILLVELVQSEDLFTEVKDALKTFNNSDFDKLISSVRCPTMRCAFLIIP